jgi:hypothetical protein
MRLNKFSLAAFVVSGSMLLAACGGGNDSPLRPISKVTTSTTAAINPTSGTAVVQAVLDKSFSFDAGVPGFGTTTPTTLKLAGSGTTPSFNLTSSEGTASGPMTFGSCIFTITASTYPAGHLLALGRVVTINPCALSVDTAGQTADGSSSPTEVTLVLGSTSSTPVLVTVSISSTGVVTVNGSTVGSATVVVTTGAGS